MSKLNTLVSRIVSSKRVQKGLKDSTSFKRLKNSRKFQKKQFNHGKKDSSRFKGSKNVHQ